MKKTIRWILLSMLAVLIFSARPVRAAGMTSVPVEFTYDQTEARKMLAMINDFRTGPNAYYLNEDNVTTTRVPGLAPLVYDYELEEAAMQRAAELAARFAHTRPDGTHYKSIRTSHSARGENIAVSGGAWPVDDMFVTFREDDDDYDGQAHRRNFLATWAVSVGIACCHDALGGTYWAVEFGAPASSAPAVPPLQGKKTLRIEVPSDDILGFDVDQPEKRFYVMEPGSVLDISGVIDPHLVMGGDCSDFMPSDTTCTWTCTDQSVAFYAGGKIFAKKAGEEVRFTFTYSSPYASDKPQAELWILVMDNFSDMPDNLTPMYRLYNPNSGEHFYTANMEEKFHLVQVGWRAEGIGWYAPRKSSRPVYRLYNPNAGDHHYTMEPAEKDMLVRVGWNYEGIGWYSDTGKDVPLYRQYNPNAKAGSHNYTTNRDENDMLVRLGWKGEGIGWYGKDYEPEYYNGDRKPDWYER